MRRINMDRAAPLVRDVLSIAISSRVSMEDLQRKSGVSINTMYSWARGRSPGIHLIIAVAGALGYELRLVRMEGKK